MNKILSFVAGISSLKIGIDILISGQHISHRTGGMVMDYGNLKYLLGLLLIFFSLACFYASYRYFRHPLKQPPATKCPKCKEVFCYKDTIEGKCPYCQDVDTIDIKEYFKMFPDEKKE